MKIKTKDATDTQLDWLVAKCEQITPLISGAGKHQKICYVPKGKRSYYHYTPSTNWKQGGPIIERENISVEFGRAEFKSKWIAYKLGEPHEDNPEGGPAPLVAAMRCFVASKLGDEVEVPDELSAI